MDAFTSGPPEKAATMKKTDIILSPGDSRSEPDDAFTLAYRKSLDELELAVGGASNLDAHLAFRSTLAAAIDMFRSSAAPVDQLAAIDLEEDLRAFDRDLARRAGPAHN